METKPGDDLQDLRGSEFSNSGLEDEPHASISDNKQSDMEISNINWVSCKYFTVAVGKAQIEEYMSTWETHPSWKFSVELVEESELEFEKQYHYRGRWSIPTCRCPIPKNTASVYFIISRSKSTAPTLPVQVRFQVESNRSVHVPGKTRFRQKWLYDVIKSKTLLLDTVTFS